MSNVKIEIVKAKLRDDLFITATFSKTIGQDSSNVTEECFMPAHDDLRKAFRQLTPHLALIAEQVRFNADYAREVDESDKADAREAVMDPNHEFLFPTTIGR